MKIPLRFLCSLVMFCLLAALVLCLEVILGSSRIRNHRCCIAFRVPVCWANLAVFISILECLNQTQSLINGTSDWEVVDSDLAQVLLSIDDEQAAE